MGATRDAANAVNPEPANLGLPIHHIGVAVPSIEDARPLFELVTGASSSRVEAVPSQGVRVCFVGWIELLEPTSDDSTVAKFLESRGQGLHHVAYRSEDLSAELARLAHAGFELIDTEPRPGAFGHSVAFLHPRSTGRVLIELVEIHGDGQAID